MTKPCLCALNLIPKTDTGIYSKSRLQPHQHVMERQTDEPLGCPILCLSKKQGGWLLFSFIIRGCSFYSRLLKSSLNKPGRLARPWWCNFQMYWSFISVLLVSVFLELNCTQTQISRNSVHSGICLDSKYTLKSTGFIFPKWFHPSDKRFNSVPCFLSVYFLFSITLHQEQWAYCSRSLGGPRVTL